MSGIADFQSWYRKQGSPVNMGLIASIVSASLLFWFTRSKGVDNFLLAVDSHERPWSFFTYAWTSMPFSNGLAIACFAFLMIWLFMCGNFVEREMGSARYAGFWFVSTTVIGLVLWTGINLMNARVAFGAAYLPISAVTMLWCARNQTTTILLYGFIPLSGKWLAIVDLIIIFLIYGNGYPLLGLFAVAPLILAYFYGFGKLPALSYRAAPREVHATRAQKQYKQSYYDDVKKREMEREERERLRKLFEGSLKDDE
ncbi:MAG: hypothetical protein ACAH95_02435 [Fimbriimonas sp.]